MSPCKSLDVYNYPPRGMVYGMDVAHRPKGDCKELYLLSVWGSMSPVCIPGLLRSAGEIATSSQSSTTTSEKAACWEPPPLKGFLLPAFPSNYYLQEGSGSIHSKNHQLFPTTLHVLWRVLVKFCCFFVILELFEVVKSTSLNTKCGFQTKFSFIKKKIKIYPNPLFVLFIYFFLPNLYLTR